ncbi:hypothetical protein A2U01_0025175 [Trifolium medium]|uniref:Endonuclease/exonuclease/phosphatase family protein n=2 Tax=Trifolium medium TaxID=97028 RepID=A0A392NWF6_9FABA|nr:hypothetical protein [Trifolium medium]
MIPITSLQVVINEGMVEKEVDDHATEVRIEAERLFHIGLGGRVKRRKVRELVRRERVDLLALQETKLATFTAPFIRGLWGLEGMGWCCNPTLGRSGGLLIMWDNDKGKLVHSFQGQGFLGVCLE